MAKGKKGNDANAPSAGGVANNYMRAFSAAWPEPEIVQRVVAQLPWRQNIALTERLYDQDTRLWYVKETIHNC